MWDCEVISDRVGNCPQLGDMNSSACDRLVSHGTGVEPHCFTMENKAQTGATLISVPVNTSTAQTIPGMTGWKWSFHHRSGDATIPPQQRQWAWWQLRMPSLWLVNFMKPLIGCTWCGEKGDQHQDYRPFYPFLRSLWSESSSHISDILDLTFNCC